MRLRSLSSRTQFMILFSGVIISTLAQAGVAVYMLVGGITVSRLPIAWYYYVGFIIGVPYIWIVGVILVERIKLLKVAHSLLLCSAIILLSTAWCFLSSPIFLLGGSVVSGIFSSVAWHMFRRAEREATSTVP